MKYFILTLIIIKILSASQINQKIITFSENEIIVKIDESDSIIVVKTYVKLYGNKIYVYDKNGNELLRFDKINWISGAFVSDDNSLIVCYSRGEAETDIVESIDIVSKRKNWGTKINAASFTISSDRSKLLTTGNPLLKSGNFGVLNLKDGSKRKINIQPNSFCAEWLDNERVVLVSIKQIIEKKNSNYKPTIQDTIDSMNISYRELRDSLTSGMISREEYKYKIDSLIAVKNKLRKREVKPSNQNSINVRRARGRERKYLREYLYSLQIYNINTDSIGDSSFWNDHNCSHARSPEIGDIPQVLLNENKDIYISR